MTKQIRLLHKPQIFHLQLLIRISKRKVKVPHELWDELGDLQEADITSDTSAASNTKLKE